MKHRRAIQVMTGAVAGVSLVGFLPVDDDSRFRAYAANVPRSSSPAPPGHDGSPIHGEERRHDCSKVFTAACRPVDPYWEQRMSGGMMGYRR
ncbi:hypothetical protein KIH27_11100 [Mycobacterium sp. M1]|uniref:Lectin-like protein BA14k n=1 Tax=Mycolicibacter acidiphilus TaxID=2835306 RepID=A0ABS5RJE3_9MYCO|nr:hypothetical protein [Mycolicibacter acidiphilus]MBS9534132.1 hypothetical protein [Mycolicibacter acidiphilus]